MFHKVTFRTSPRYKISMVVLKEVPSDDNKVNKRELSPNEVLYRYQNKYDVQILFYLHPVNKWLRLLIMNCTTFNSNFKDLLRLKLNFLTNSETIIKLLPTAATANIERLPTVTSPEISTNKFNKQPI